MNGEVTNEVLHLLLSSIATRLKDAEERVEKLEVTGYTVEVWLTALEAKGGK
jgi:hypothetical protein